MASLSSRGLGLSAFGRCGRSARLSTSQVRASGAHPRPVVQPFLLAPGPTSPRSGRQRTRFVVRNFKPSEPHPEDAPVVRPKPVRHPITEDPFSGAGAAETATQHFLHAIPAAPSAPKAQGFLQKATSRVQRVVKRIDARALLDILVNNWWQVGAAAYLVLWLWQPLWISYNQSLEAHPVVTKTLTGLIGGLIGDYVSQMFAHHEVVMSAEERGEAVPAFTYDVVRAGRLFAYNVVIGTPLVLTWLNFLDTHIYPEAMTSPTTVLFKVALDQLVMTPLSTALFFVVMRTMEGHPDDSIACVRAKLLPTLMANYCLWPFAHMFNFAFVPASHRILFMNAVGLLWAAILNTIANDKMPPETSSGAASTVGGGPGPTPGGGAGSPVPGGRPVGSSGGGSPVGPEAGLRRPGMPPPASPKPQPGSAYAFTSSPDLPSSPSRVRTSRGAVQPTAAFRSFKK